MTGDWLDDTVKLVYADWLQERGEEQMANDIRAMIAGTLSKKGLRRLLYAHAQREESRGRSNLDGSPCSTRVVLVRRARRLSGTWYGSGWFWVYYLDLDWSLRQRLASYRNLPLFDGRFYCQV